MVDVISGAVSLRHETPPISSCCFIWGYDWHHEPIRVESQRFLGTNLFCQSILPLNVLGEIFMVSHLLSPAKTWLLRSNQHSWGSWHVSDSGVNDFREDLKRMMTDVTKGEGKAGHVASRGAGKIEGSIGAVQKQPAFYKTINSEHSTDSKHLHIMHVLQATLCSFRCSLFVDPRWWLIPELNVRNLGKRILGEEPWFSGRPIHGWWMRITTN